MIADVHLSFSETNHVQSAEWVIQEAQKTQASQFSCSGSSKAQQPLGCQRSDWKLISRAKNRSNKIRLTAL